MYNINLELESRIDREKYIGKIFESKHYGEFSVKGVYGKDRTGTKTYVCEFVKTKYQSIVTAGNINKGNAKDLLLPSIYNHGYIGNFYNNVRELKSYVTWVNMLKRVYSKDELVKNPTYIDAFINERWHCFKNFNEDYSKILGVDKIIEYPNIKFCLDKDIITDTKTYSLNNCCFIPEQINNIFINKQITNSTGYEGTYYLEDDLVYISAVKYKGNKISLGRFLDVREAYEKYHIKKKEILLLYLKDFYWIDSKIKNACLNKLERQYTQTINNNIKVVI